MNKCRYVRTRKHEFICYFNFDLILANKFKDILLCMNIDSRVFPLKLKLNHIELFEYNMIAVEYI